MGLVRHRRSRGQLVPGALLECDGSTVRSRPIKGTRPRGDSAEADAALAEERSPASRTRPSGDDRRPRPQRLLARLRAGHGRGGALAGPRVRLGAPPGGGRDGRLQPGRTALGALLALFPGGSISGPRSCGRWSHRRSRGRRTRPLTGTMGMLDVTGARASTSSSAPRPCAGTPGRPPEGQLQVGAGSPLLGSWDEERGRVKGLRMARALGSDLFGGQRHLDPPRGTLLAERVLEPGRERTRAVRDLARRGPYDDPEPETVMTLLPALLLLAAPAPSLPLVPTPALVSPRTTKPDKREEVKKLLDTFSGPAKRGAEDLEAIGDALPRSSPSRDPRTARRSCPDRQGLQGEAPRGLQQRARQQAVPRGRRGAGRDGPERPSALVDPTQDPPQGPGAAAGADPLAGQEQGREEGQEGPHRPARPQGRPGPGRHRGPRELHAPRPQGAQGSSRRS